MLQLTKPKNQNNMKRLLFLLLLLTSTVAFSQTETTYTCKDLKDCRLDGMGKGEGSYLIIKNTKHREVIPSQGITIKSKVEWISDCQFKVIFQSVNMKNAPMKKGDVMIVTVSSIEGDIVTGITQVENLSVPIKYRISKP